MNNNERKEYYINKGIILYLEHKYNEAIDFYDKILEENSDHTGAL